MKKILSILLALCLLVGALPMSAFADTEGFVIGDDGVLVEYTGKGGEVVIPDGVTSIGAGAFSRCTGLTSVIMPDSVTSIGYHAFSYCTSLTSVTISNSITLIPEWAFRGCTSLTSITIPDSVTDIDNLAFAYTGLTSVTFPDSVTFIGKGAFLETNLTSVTIPAGVTNNLSEPFGNCDKLKEIQVDADNKDLTSVDGALFNKEKTELIQYPAGRTETSYTIPDSVTDIDAGAFMGCTRLTDVTIPDSVTYIGGMMYSDGAPGAFAGCTGLKNITIPDSVTSMGTGAFMGCNGLTSVTISSGLDDIPIGTFMGCTRLINVAIPDSVIRIGWQAFDHCEEIKDVYYGGTMSQWGAIDIQSECGNLLNATIHCKDGVLNEKPTETPTPTPTPTPVLTTQPSATPSASPSVSPSASPSALPSAKPSVSPSAAPSASPSANPSNSPSPNPSTKPNFTDVPAKQYYTEPVIWAVEKGITSGIGGGKFGPENSCTRGQIVTFLWRAAGSPDPVSSANPFSDVKPSDYFYNAVLWAVENNITSGIGGGKFGPSGACTRGQAVTFLWRAEKSPNTTVGSSFSDVKSGSYYEKAVDWAVSKNVTSGTGNGKFSPDASCTRGQIVTFLYRAND